VLLTAVMSYRLSRLTSPSAGFHRWNQAVLSPYLRGQQIKKNVNSSRTVREPAGRAIDQLVRTLGTGKPLPETFSRRGGGGLCRGWHNGEAHQPVRHDGAISPERPPLGPHLLRRRAPTQRNAPWSIDWLARQSAFSRGNKGSILLFEDDNPLSTASRGGVTECLLG